MNYYEVAPTKIVRAGADTFTYSSDSPLSIGQLVVVEAGKKQFSGLIIKDVKKPEYTTKPIVSVIDETPVPQAFIDTLLWLASYYLTPLALVLQTALPSGLTKNRRTSSKTVELPTRDRTKIVFNKEQTEAIETLSTGVAGTYLLQGVTGSGKTEVYKELARRTLAKGQSVIVLTPEIGLTPQLVAEFTQDIPNVLLTHSGQTEAERHKTWLEALHAATPRVAIGPRSALFLPLANVGLIVVDESHEPSYKQEQAPRYSALRVATMLGRAHGATVVFGSATPSITDRYLAEQTGRPVVILTERARPGAHEAEIAVIDNKDHSQFKHHRFLSDPLLLAIEHNLASHKQTLLFHNRRGSAATTLCEHCGWTALCPNCFVPLTLHSDHYELRCHLCGHHEKVPNVCPVCRHADIIHKGIGTKLIESELKRRFPKARIARFDSDNTGDTTVSAQYQALYNGEIDIAIGTQMVAKGLDLPHLGTVGVIQADSGLALPDYASEERTFQLLSQVIGRVGRTEHPTNVFIQTYQPTHPAIVSGIAQDYQSFYIHTLEARKAAHFPPFVFLLKLVCVYKTEAAAIRNAQALARTLKTELKNVQVLGPTPAFYERVGDTYRWQLVLKSKKREYLIDALAFVPTTHWQAELDPASLL